MAPEVQELSTKSTGEALSALEGFFCSPVFTSALGEFMSENAPRLKFVGMDTDQPIGNHEIYMQYQQLVENQLSAFLAEQGVKLEEIWQAAEQVKASGQSASLACVDYMIACTEYEEFMQLAYDHTQLSQYNPEAGAIDDCELPPASDDGGDVAFVTDLGECEGDSGTTGQGRLLVADVTTQMAHIVV